jgi:hypothetical protein|tara:strand:- start:3606 stop:3824 length:219 start_codon:yes stop_codon:yes gene_type:complete
MSPFSKALDMVAHDKSVHRILIDSYWSKKSKKPQQREAYEQKMFEGYKLLSLEQQSLLSSVHHVWNRNQLQS